MLPYLQGACGNANSLHQFGKQAHSAVELARERIASLIGADDPYQIIFTSGATEANNQVIRAFPGGHMSPFEHSAVLEPGKAHGFRTLANSGLVLEPLDSETPLVSIMSVNNEIGTIWNLSDWCGKGNLVHSDITQAVGKIAFRVENLDFATFSAHKFYGPKGIGALYFKEYPPQPLLLGGEQEHGFRGGTLNVAGIVGMGVAAQIAQDEFAENYAHAQELRAILLEELVHISDMLVNGGESISPYILSCSFPGLEGESLVIELDRKGFAISSGAACSSHSNEPSHVLTSLKLNEKWLRGTVRVSFGRFCSVESAQSLSKSMRHTVEKLRNTF